MLQKNLSADEELDYSEELNTSESFNFDAYSAVSTTCILISILGLIGNGIIFWLLCCPIKKTKFTIYVANVAVADILVLLHSLIVNLYVYKPDFYHLLLNQLVLILGFFGFETKSYFLAAISTKRFLTVFSPVWYQYHRQKYSTAFVCTFIWTLSVILKILDYFVCSAKYISVLQIGPVPCKIETIFTDNVLFIIVTFLMVFSTLALCIRMKRKPQQDFPARLDISICIIVVLHLVLHSATEIIVTSLFSFLDFTYDLELILFEKISYCMSNSINPFVYLLVGCWKWEKGGEPFYMFLERALKDNGKGSMRIQPDQELG